MIFEVGNKDDDEGGHDSRNKDGPYKRRTYIRSVLKNHNKDDAHDNFNHRILPTQFFLTTSRPSSQNKKR